MKNLKEYITESKSRDDIFKKSPFYKKNLFFGTGLSLEYFLKYFELNKPIVGGNWNPREYITTEQLNEYFEWLKENNSELKDNLYVVFGDSYEGDDNNVKPGELYKWLTDKLGYPVGGRSIRASCFGKIGIGDKYYANHYFKTGALIEKGKTKLNKKTVYMSWVLFLDQESFEKVGLIADKTWEESNEESNSTNNQQNQEISGVAVQ